MFWPERWALLVPVRDERWAAARDRWAVVPAGAVLVGVPGAVEPLRRRVRFQYVEWLWQGAHPA
ncbi:MULTISPECIES: hypothetical protein [unclassified Streptomyces]|uniref:hypothetical protein n=1 Tax=unclassified Streptomyces TaxID=2593676 RepID=UPI0036E5B631